MKEKNARLELRLPAKEKEQLEQLARKCGLTVAEYLRKRGLGYEPGPLLDERFYMVYRKEIIDTFVNSVFVYDDKLVLTYNYKDGTETLTLQEIESALSSNLTSMCPPEKRKPTQRVGFSFFLVDL